MDSPEVVWGFEKVWGWKTTKMTERVCSWWSCVAIFPSNQRVHSSQGLLWEGKWEEKGEQPSSHRRSRREGLLPSLFFLSFMLLSSLGPLLGHGEDGLGDSFERKAETETVVVLEGLGSGGSFVLHSLLARVVQRGGPVCLVCAVHALSHYETIARKQGYNLSSAITTGQVHVIDLLSGQESLSSITLPHPRELFTRIQRLLPSQGGSVLIDDASVFMQVHGPASMHQFVHYCRVIARSRMVVVCAHADDVDHVDTGRVLRSLQHEADIVVEASCLASGPTRDVQGQLRIVFPHRAICAEKNQTLVLYKLSETSVRLIRPGTIEAAIGP